MISKKDVQHIARLARIELTPAEEKKFEKDLSDILDFVNKLSEVDTSGVEPLTGGTDLKNVMREDNQGDKMPHSEAGGLVEAAPRHHDGFVEVKAVFNRDER